MDDTNQSISKAVSLFRNPAVGDWDIYAALVGGGVEQRVAARLVEFLPMVYCRLILASTDVKFATTFQRMLPGGGISVEKPLSLEPIWEACTAFASEEARRTVSANDLVAIAAHGSEYSVVSQLRKDGSKLDAVLTPVLMAWPENGPPL